MTMHDPAPGAAAPGIGSGQPLSGETILREVLAEVFGTAPAPMHAHPGQGLPDAPMGSVPQAGLAANLLESLGTQASSAQTVNLGQAHPGAASADPHAAESAAGVTAGPGAGLPGAGSPPPSVPGALAQAAMPTQPQPSAAPQAPPWLRAPEGQVPHQAGSASPTSAQPVQMGAVAVPMGAHGSPMGNPAGLFGASPAQMSDLSGLLDAHMPASRAADFALAFPGAGSAEMQMPESLAGIAANPLHAPAAAGAPVSAAAPHAMPPPGIPHYYFLPHAADSPSFGAALPFDVNAVRSDFPALRQRVHGQPLIWLDNAATTQKPQSVIDAVSRFYERDNSNIHRAAHEMAARATEAYERARGLVQKFLGAAKPEECVFVRGTTEAINLVAQTLGRQRVGRGDEIVVTELEHHANIVPWQMLAQEKCAELKVVPVTDSGEVLLEDFAKAIGPRTRFVAVAHVSNVLGTVLPVREIAALAHRHGAVFVVDGAQAVAHTPVRVREIDADFYVLSGHKLFAPTGVGALYGKEDLLREMPPWQGGGNMIRDVSFTETTYSDPPQKFEAGTGTIGDAVGLGAAIEYISRIGIEAMEAYERMLTAYAMERLLAIPGLRMIGTAPEKVGVFAFTLDGVPVEQIGRQLDAEGIAVRAGHHCAQPIHARFGIPATVRPSLALYNTIGDIDALLEALHRIRGK